jgi:hypothetical protein
VVDAAGFSHGTWTGNPVEKGPISRTPSQDTLDGIQMADQSFMRSSPYERQPRGGGARKSLTWSLPAKERC